MSGTQLPALVPVTIVHSGQRLDMALPAAVALAEVLPGITRALGRLSSEAATQGFRVLTATGKELNQALSLSAQDVSAGAVLTLEALGAGASDMRYDDLVEAIGTSVEASRKAWTRGDSIQLSSYSAAALFAVAALLLVFGGNQHALGAAIAVVGAVLVTMAAAVLNRIGVPGGAVAMALMAPLLLGAAGYALISGPATELRLAAAGAGIVAGCVAFFVLGRRTRMAVVGPMVAGLAAIAVGGQTGYFQVAEPRAAALVVTVLALVVLAAPWLGLAQVPARIDALSPQPRQEIDGPDVHRQVGNADVAMLSLRIAAGIVLAALAPLIAKDVTGALLMACVGVASVLGTRSLYGHHEVLAGALGGMLTLTTAGLATSIAMPKALPWLVGLTIAIGGFVVAWNVVSVKARPWLTRVADGLHIVALLGLLPLAASVWGLI